MLRGHIHSASPDGHTHSRATCHTDRATQVKILQKVSGHTFISGSRLVSVLHRCTIEVVVPSAGTYGRNVCICVCVCVSCRIKGVFARVTGRGDTHNNPPGSAAGYTAIPTGPTHTPTQTRTQQNTSNNTRTARRAAAAVSPQQPIGASAPAADIPLPPSSLPLPLPLSSVAPGDTDLTDTVGPIAPAAGAGAAAVAAGGNGVGALAQWSGPPSGEASDNDEQANTTQQNNNNKDSVTDSTHGGMGASTRAERKPLLAGAGVGVDTRLDVRGPPCVMSWENVTVRIALPGGKERYILQVRVCVCVSWCSGARIHALLKRISSASVVLGCALIKVFTSTHTVCQPQTAA